MAEFPASVRFPEPWDSTYLRAGSRRGDPWSPAYLGSAACAGHHKSVVDESGRYHPGQKAAFNVGSIINASGPAKLPLASNHRILGQSNRRAVRVEEMEGADCGMAGWRSDKIGRASCRERVEISV